MLKLGSVHPCQGQHLRLQGGDLPRLAGGEIGIDGTISDVGDVGCARRAMLAEKRGLVLEMLAVPVTFRLTRKSAMSLATAVMSARRPTLMGDQTTF